MPSFWTDQFDVRLQSFGALELVDDVRLLDGDLDGEFVAGYLRDGVLVGVVGVGKMSVLMSYRAELAARRSRQQTALTSWALVACAGSSEAAGLGVADFGVGEGAAGDAAPDGSGGGLIASATSERIAAMSGSWGSITLVVNGRLRTPAFLTFWASSTQAARSLSGMPVVMLFLAAAAICGKARATRAGSAWLDDRADHAALPAHPVVVVG